MFGKKGISAVDIGNSSIKAVELSKRFGKIGIKSFDASLVRPTSFSGGEIVQAEGLQSSIQSNLKDFSKDVIFSCCGSSMMVKKISIPKIDPEFIPDQIRWEAEQYIPFNIDEVNIEFEVVDSPADSENMGLLLVAILKSKVKSYASIFQNAGFIPKIADVSGFALANCFTYNYPEVKNEAVVLLDIGAYYTNLVVLNRGKVVYYRDIQFGGSKYDEELSKNLGVTKEEARSIKQTSNPATLPDIAADTIVSLNEKLSSQILGSLDFFKNTESFTRGFSKIYVTGGGSLAPGLTKNLSRTLGAGVEYMNALKKISVPSKVLKSTNEVKLQYMSAVAIGLSLREIQ